MKVTDKHREDARHIVALMLELEEAAWEPLANLLAGYDAGCKAEAIEYKRLFDALFEIEGMTQSDPGNVPQWVDEIIQSVQAMTGVTKDGELK